MLVVRPNLLLVIGVVLAFWVNTDAVAGQPRASEDILEEVKAIGEPDFDPARKEEPGYVENYKREQHILYRKKAALLLELCRLYPDHPKLPEWMNRRWVLLGWNQEPARVADKVLADIEAVLAKNENAQVAHDGAYWRAYFLAHKHAGDARTMMQDVGRFVETYPKDERGAELLDLVAGDESAEREFRISLYRRLARDFPRTHYGTYAPGMVRRLESTGEPFELEFKDVTTGRAVSVAELRGKVVLIDFWATTCTPCVAEMPHLKELYAKYHERGVEFVGVSLDESEEAGGKSALRRFIKKQDIPWPQYYQGNGYASDFSKSWGVGSAPTMFILDQEGRLRYTDVVGKVEDLIIKLLTE